MTFRTIVASIALFLASPLVGREKSDVIVMKNGDRMTCEIKGLESGVLYVSLDYVDGTIAVDWSKVARLESSHLFIVKTLDGSVYRGILSTVESLAEGPMTLQVAEGPGKEVVLKRPQIIDLAETSDKFWQRFSGAVNWGINYSKGNSSTQYNLGAQTAYLRPRWSADLSFNSTLSSTSGVTASTQNQAFLKAERLLRWNNYFYSGLANFIQSSAQGINLQSSLGAAIGRYLKRTDNSTFSLSGGAGWQETHYTQSVEPIPTQELATAMMAADVRFSKFKRTNFNLTAVLYPALSDPGRVHFTTNTYFYIKIFGDLSWNITAYLNWDNRPPANLPRSSYGASSGLSWTFGLK
jgi:hypothetical protein